MMHAMKYRGWFSFLAAMTAAVWLSAGAAFAQARQDAWVSLAPLPEAAAEVLGAVANGKLYVLCGLAPGFKPRGMVLEYDPAANSWTAKKPMALPAHHVALTSANGKIYAFGGFVLPPSGPPSWAPIDNAWEYDPTADSWRALAPMPTKRGAAAAAEVDGKIYVIGGTTTPSGVATLTPTSPQSVVGTVEEYDVKTNSWRTRAAMPTPRNHHAVGVVNGKIYAIGGRVGSVFIPWSNSLDLVEAYDPATDKWGRELDRMPTPRSGPAWGVYNGRIYVAGGEYQDRRLLAAFRAFEVYDVAKNQWSVLTSMPNPRHGAAGGVIGNRFYVVGGESQSGGSGVRGETAFNQAITLD